MEVTSEPIKHGLEIGCKNRSYKCLQILLNGMCVSAVMKMMMMMWNFEIMSNKFVVDDCDDDDDEYDDELL